MSSILQNFVTILLYSSSIIGLLVIFVIINDFYDIDFVIDIFRNFVTNARFSFKIINEFFFSYGLFYVIRDLYYGKLVLKLIIKKILEKFRKIL